MRGLFAASIVIAVLTAQAAPSITWRDLPVPVQQRLERSGLSADGFPAWLAETRARHAVRVREGDEDHLIFYALQSSQTTTLPAIEPAASAARLMSSLDAAARARFVEDPWSVPAARIPEDARARLDVVARVLARPAIDPRLRYLQELVGVDTPRRDLDTRLARAYLRAMRFLAEQQAAATAANAASEVARLYRTRGLSTDTSVEAGYLVHLGFATLKALAPATRLRHVVIVGPGLDLAPRTGLVDAAPPQSVQPFVVADALVALGLAEPGSLTVTCLDINPRVVSHLQRARESADPLVLVTGVATAARIALADDYRAYVDSLGSAIGAADAASPTDDRYGRRLRKIVRLRPGIRSIVTAGLLDVVVERLSLQADAIVVTNVLPYFDDRELTLALANIAAMLAPSGVLVHNEARPEVGEITRALGVPLKHARTAIVATVRGAAPLYDSVFIHQK